MPPTVIYENFEWDTEKRITNREKHLGVDFQVAIRIFEGRVSERHDDRHNYGEERFQAVGSHDGRIYFVVFTRGDGRLRILSARIANGRDKASFAPQA